jgi:hypothetical protein
MTRFEGADDRVRGYAAVEAPTIWPPTPTAPPHSVMDTRAKRFLSEKLRIASKN